MIIARRFRRRLRCFRKGHRWHVYYVDDEHEHCGRCGKCRSAATRN